MKKTASLLVLLSSLVITIATIQSASDVAAQGKKKSADGKAIYQAQCAKCHAEDGKGITSLPDIPNFADSKWQSSRTDKRIAEVISVGEGIMPGFKEVLSAAELGAVLRQVRTFAPASPKGKSR